ncbi:MAG TPA: hypothetical protein VMS76_11150 [Planctomycetota bacterium]|nr:hypothetical protein [Planctomycetota bacterium]
MLALGLTMAWGNPYLAGTATLYRVRDEASPAASLIRAEASRVASAAADLGGIAVAALPRAAMRASRAVTTTVIDRFDGDESGADLD